MRILLDHCVPRVIKSAIKGHFVSTADEMGWSSLSNGELLRQAGQSFDVFLTVDTNIKHEQNLSRLPIAIIVARVRSTRVKHVLECLPAVERAMNQLQPRRLVEVSPSPQDMGDRT